MTSLRRYHHIPACSPERSWRTLAEAAEELRISRSVLRRLIRTKLLPAKQVVKHAPWVIERKDYFSNRDIYESELLPDRWQAGRTQAG